jgi:hypothetical protein
MTEFFIIYEKEGKLLPKWKTTINSGLVVAITASHAS